MEVFATVVGVTFRGASAKEIVKHLTTADGELLELQPEPTNEYDSNAVQVIYKPTDEHIGYLARENNYEVFCALMEGREVELEIVGFENTLKPTLLIKFDEGEIPLTAEDLGEFPGER